LELSHYIKELLYQHDCVIIPGLGGFVANYRSAEIDSRGGMFYPPLKYVSFNVKLNHDDGLLISHIASQKGLDYGEAKKLVQSQVDYLSKKLIRGKKIILDGIGELYFDKSANLQFDPDPNSNFSTAAYGLAPFSFPPLKEYYQSQSKSKHYLDKEHTGRKGASKYVKYALAGIPVAAAIFYVSVKTDIVREAGMEISTLNPFSMRTDSGVSLEEPRADEEKDRNAEALEKLSSQKEALYYREQVQRDEQSAEPGKHYLIAGSFRYYKNALELKKSLEEEGYTPQILEADNGMFRVAMDVFTSSDEALSELKAKKQKQPGIWLLSE